LKKRSAASLQFRPDGVTAMRITTEASPSYRILWCEEARLEDPLPSRVQRELSGQFGGVCQVLPGEDVHHLIVPLPPLAPKLRAAAIRGVVVREKGGELRDWVTTFTELPAREGSRRGGRQDFSTYCVRTEVVRRHLERARGLGVRPTVALAPFGLLDDLYRKHRVVDPAVNGWNLVHLGRTARFLCVGEPGGLLFSRPLPEDLSRGAELTEYIERLATEVERSNFFAQQAERSLRVDQVVVCGDAELADALTTRLAERQFPVVRWRPEDLFAWPDDEPRPELLLAVSGAVAALGDGGNLLPADVRPDRGRTVRRQVQLVVQTSVGAAVPLLFGAALLTEHIQRDALREMAQRENELLSRAQVTATAYLQNRALLAREANLTRLDDADADLEGLLRDIATLAPSAVVFQDLTLRRDPDGRYRLILSGESRGYDGMDAQEVYLGFHAGLGACSRLREVGEPAQLELAADDESSAGGSRVSFTLEYVVEGGPS
jgi:hypothetical protein